MRWVIFLFFVSLVLLGAAIGVEFVAHGLGRSEWEQFRAEHHCNPVGKRVEYRQVWLCDGGAMTLH